MADPDAEMAGPGAEVCGGPETLADGVRIVAYEAAHLEGILRLCAAQGWPSLPSDPERAGRALSAPGVTTVVALQHGAVAGFAQLLSDGELQAYLALALVAPACRGSGIGRSLVEGATQRAGDVRVDVLASPDSTGFYERFAHKVMPGYRIYPGVDTNRGVDPGVAAPPSP